MAGYQEGMDLDIRLRNAGHEIWWVPGAAVRHLVHAGRLNMKWFLHAAFNSGRTTAIQRLKIRTNSDRVLYAGGRLLIAPLHFAVNITGAVFIFPFQNGRLAAGELMRAASIAGFAWGLLRQTFFDNRAGLQARIPEDA